MKNAIRYGLVSILTASFIGVVAPAFAAQDSDKDGVPDSAEALIHADPMNADTDGDGMNDLKDDNPVVAINPIKDEGGTAPFVIKQALVEDNYDYVARKDATDHLELLVANNSTSELGGFSVFYTITDKDSGVTEAYYKQLDGFSVPAGAEARVHFDDSGLPGHFRANPNSIYVTNAAAKTFSVELKSEGSKPVKVEIQKDAGGAETAD